MMGLAETITGPVTTAPGSPAFYPEAKVEYTGKMCFESPFIPFIGRERTIQNVIVGQPKTYCAALIDTDPMFNYVRIAATVGLAWWILAHRGGSK